MLQLMLMRQNVSAAESVHRIVLSQLKFLKSSAILKIYFNDLSLAYIKAGDILQFLLTSILGNAIMIMTSKLGKGE